METQGDRFRKIREKAGLSKLEFARSIDIPPSLASYIESGTREASKDVLQRLAVTYKINLNWYIFGESEMFISDSGARDSVDILHIEQEAAAGRGVDIDDFPELHSVSIPRSLVSGFNPANLRAVTVRGDSMIDREIHDRDIVVFNPKDTEGESISVVSIAGQLLVKYVAVDRIKNAVSLISANAVYPPRIITGEDLADVKIEGRVVVCLHRM